MNNEIEILSVSEVTRRIKRLLEGGFRSIRLQGEVSNFKQHAPSGHMYFTLKDESSAISAVMWRSRVGSLTFMPEDGMKVVVSGRLAVYEVRGTYQIDVYSMQPLGMGDLQIAFEKLKQRLASEGLFNAEFKIPIPRFPERIGIVTSPSGAALHDLLTVLKRRQPSVAVIVRPVKVQGPGAARDIATAIDEMNEFDGADIVILARGGGSLEDLWAFNEEVVARSIFRSKLPIVSAVGHEIDFTIADFVADMRAPTPSAAAELVVEDRGSLLDIIRNNWYTTHESVLSVLKNRKDHIRHLLRSHAFNRPIDDLRQMSQRIDEIDRSMGLSVAHLVALQGAHLHSFDRRIRSLDPEAVLRRGYVMVSKGEHIVDSSKRLHRGDHIELRFHDGNIPSTVTKG
ncbi:MAG: exodeoxyribonuclease VII large subunit [Ignavibacteria bacterium]|nr:exodeoxyribonuclease VII large subunit [Ignavibacteria bacterium]